MLALGVVSVGLINSPIGYLHQQGCVMMAVMTTAIIEARPATITLKWKIQCTLHRMGTSGIAIQLLHLLGSHNHHDLYYPMIPIEFATTWDILETITILMSDETEPTIPATNTTLRHNGILLVTRLFTTKQIRTDTLLLFPLVMNTGSQVREARLRIHEEQDSHAPLHRLAMTEGPRLNVGHRHLQDT